MSAGGGGALRPWHTTSERCGSQCAVSRSHVSFIDAGQITTAGYASAASTVASASTVLPSPCSSARNVARASSA